MSWPRDSIRTVPKRALWDGLLLLKYEIATMMYPAVLSQGDEITVNLHSDGTGYPCDAVKGGPDGFTYFAAYMITRT